MNMIENCSAFKTTLRILEGFPLAKRLERIGLQLDDEASILEGGRRVLLALQENEYHIIPSNKPKFQAEIACGIQSIEEALALRKEQDREQPYDDTVIV